MKIQILAGGLANQIRHYLFVRFAERYRPGSEWWFDDSYFYTHKDHNGYEMERLFGARLNLLSDFFDGRTWEKIVEQRKRGVILPQTLLDMGTPIVLFEGRLYIDQARFSGKTILAEGEHLGFHPEYIDLPYENVYYHAKWASRKWFDAYAEENRQELRFPPLQEQQNIEYADMINNSYSVGIHVRRTGFLDTSWDISADQYQTACRQVLEGYPDANFFIFSDDIAWCKENAELCGFNLAASTTYVTGNVEPNNYIDMQLLSMCNGMIRNAESSFSQVAGWLDPKLEFDYKICPKCNSSDPLCDYKISTLTTQAQQFFSMYNSLGKRLVP